MSKFQPFFSLKHPKVRPFLEYLSQAVPKVPEIKFTRLTWIFQKSSQLPCLLMSLWDLKNASLCTGGYLAEVFFCLSWWHKKKDGTKQNNGEEAMNSYQAVQKNPTQIGWRLGATKKKPAQLAPPFVPRWPAFVIGFFFLQRIFGKTQLFFDLSVIWTRFFILRKAKSFTS